ncbi:hypothetical protein [Streptomyces lonegramiae]|uniref:Uncharacterized protein n=1 Tax=Streptomyces lonegramiae TaxID=3075524 RepID=A0ABU2XUR0_9ACTN|nr:hypothetical protein [Streptomyces sp. DSM 41529]MDT0549212.1 hypothetical protein [Streptomyces sp. DSM 41529]
MPQGWTITIRVAAAAGIVSTPLFWLLDGPNAGQLVGSSVQGATSVAALVWTLFHSTSPGSDDTAIDTGKAWATGGGGAHSGVRRPGGSGIGAATAVRTGDATAHGPGSSAVTGIDYT